MVLSDLHEVVPLLENNLKQHRAGHGGTHAIDGESNAARVDVQAVPWGDKEAVELLLARFEQEGRTLSHVVCSDLVYFPHLLEPLLKTLLWLTDDPKRGLATEVIFGCKQGSLEATMPL